STYTFNVVSQGNVGVPPLPAGQAYTLGAQIGSTIGAPGEQDTYRFTVPEGQTTRVYMDSLASSALRWRLVGPRGTVVSDRAFDSTDGEYQTGQVAYNLVAGDYALTISGSGSATGGYSFRLLDLAQSTVIEPGVELLNQQLNPGNSTRVYSFTTNAPGERIYIDLTQKSSSAAVYWRLIDPYGRTELLSPYFMSAGSDLDTTTLALAGTYTLLVEGHVNNPVAVETLAFTLRKVTDDTAPLALGASTSGTLVEGQTDSYTFTLGEAH